MYTVQVYYVRSTLFTDFYDINHIKGNIAFDRFWNKLKQRKKSWIHTTKVQTDLADWAHQIFPPKDKHVEIKTKPNKKNHDHHDHG